MRILFALSVTLFSPLAAGQVLPGGIQLENNTSSSSEGTSVTGTVFESPFVPEDQNTEAYSCHDGLCGEHTHVFLQLAELPPAEVTIGRAATLTGIDTIIDDGSDWYLVQPGDIFGPATIEGSPYPLIVGAADNLGIEFGSVDLDIPTVYGDETFYLAVAVLGPDNAFGPRDSFGWAEVRYQRSSFPGALLPTLEIVDSAMAYGMGPIIVGTTRTVPEPATFLQLLLAGMLGTPARRHYAR